MLSFYLLNHDKRMLITYKGVRTMIEKIVAQSLSFYPEVKREYLKIEHLNGTRKVTKLVMRKKECLFFVLLDNEGELDSFSIETDYFGDDKVLMLSLI